MSIALSGEADFSKGHLFIRRGKALLVMLSYKILSFSIKLSLTNRALNV